MGISAFVSAVCLILTMAAGYQGWELIATHKAGVVLTKEQERLELIEEMHRQDHEVTQQPRPV